MEQDEQALCHRSGSAYSDPFADLQPASFFSSAHGMWSSATRQWTPARHARYRQTRSWVRDYMPPTAPYTLSLTINRSCKADPDSAGATVESSGRAAALQ
jgi:hypothetical protein